MWKTVELRELRLFLTLAEELHFGRTAEKLRLTPSRVSQSLRALEQKLGAQLVHRTSRRVKLTSFGEQLRRELGPALEQLDGVLDRAHAAARSVEGTLRLGIFSAPAGGPHLVEITRAFEALHTSSTVEVVQMSWDDPFERLREGEIDLMATWLPLDQPDLVVGPVLTEQPRALALAQDHPLADRDSVDVEELADHRLLRFDNWPKELHEAIVPSQTPCGRPIERLRIPVGERSVSDVAVRVARGEIAYPTVASAASYMGDLSFIPITGMPELRSALVWRRPARDPKLRAFLAVARDVLASD
ncbi:MAG: LysR family transcriptional regulator [Solirubrobacterales bacterium]|nr:LysR family transcriptional regulator [Solirubrobacterales bacterium]